MTISLSWLLSLFALYAIVFMLLVLFGERYGENFPRKIRTAIYSLSLGVYCSSWALFGSIGQNNLQNGSFLPIFIGPILLLVVAPWFIKKMVIISKQEGITSIADFIAARYGKSDKLAVLVTLTAMIGLLPYLALQLKSIALGAGLLTAGIGAADASSLPNYALWASVFLAGFVMLLTTRRLDVSEQQRGLVFAIAADALFKLVAFVVVAFFILHMTQTNLPALWHSAELPQVAQAHGGRLNNWLNIALQSCIAMMALYTLPHMFHITAVENSSTSDLRTMRWAFPLYLILVAAFVIPFAVAGQLFLPFSSHPDVLAVELPLAKGNSAMALLVYFAGTSAAISMLVIAVLSLSIMLSKHVVMPVFSGSARLAARRSTLNSRRLSIAMILLLSYVCHEFIQPQTSLSQIGYSAMGALIQLAPAMIGALIWKNANRQGVYAGLLAGMLSWGYLLGLPLFSTNAASWPLLSNLLTLPDDALLSYTTLAVGLSIGANFVVFILVSLFTRTGVSEHWQANRFIGMQVGNKTPFTVQVGDLLTLTSRFIGEDRAKQSFIRFAYKQHKDFNLTEVAGSDWLAHTERLLADVLGASSTKAVIKAALEGREMHIEDVVRIVGEASEVLQFNRSLLQGAIENITQGISVVDRQLRLVAWNSRYLELFDYPPELVTIGRPVADIIRHNAEKGLCGPGDVETHVSKRLYWMRQGTAHTSERMFPNGRVIELIGNPMPGGGFVMSFTDITAFREAERGLKEANESLEQRVSERTSELSSLNQELTRAKAQAEDANASKTRFLAAVSHDLMQPLNAARLFSASLSHQPALPDEAMDLVRNLDSALGSAEDLISDLLDISRIESGRINANVQPFELEPWLEGIGAEFKVLAQQQGIDFRLRNNNVKISSDVRLLRRIVQNFLTNAFRYAQGQVLLAARRRGDQLRLEVWDKGEGIPPEKLKFIFEEFKRLDSHQTREEKGLGLGLAIADGFCRVLNHQLEVKSRLGKGSVFSVSVPLFAGEIAPVKTEVAPVVTQNNLLKSFVVLCVDNEESILTGMHSLLTRWGCETHTARNLDECQQLLEQGVAPDLVLIDYHLDHGQTGVELMARLRQQLDQPELPGIVISADARAELADTVKESGLNFLRKPVKPAALRALINQHL